MIVSKSEYESMLVAIEAAKQNGTYYIDIPENEKKYKIDLNTRKIEAPPLLGVLEDHASEIIWFEVDRFYDSYDLFHAVCVIQFINANKEVFYHQTFPQQKIVDGQLKLYIPWAISQEVTKKQGTIQFSIRFFTLDEQYEKYVFSINTLPANSKVENTLIVKELTEDNLDNNLSVTTSTVAGWMKMVEELDKDFNVYWIDADELI